MDNSEFTAIEPATIEYILVSDLDSKVLKAGTYLELKVLAGIVRRAGGQCTIFKATKG